MKKYLILSVLFAVTFFFITCGEDKDVSVNSNVPLTINIDVSEEQLKAEPDFTTAQLEQCLGFVSNVRIVVQGNFPTITRLFSVGQRIIIFLPPGEMTISVSLENDSGEVCCFGQREINLVPGVANSVTIPCEPVGEICNNSQDDNGNGLVDCQESTCEGFPCDTNNQGNVCMGSECSAPPATETDCSDGEDNDFDEGTDCEDVDCASDPACIETVCDDGIDNDSDGDTDCDDIDCSEDTACDEVCFGGEDEDNDGDVDCSDGECDNQSCNENDGDFICIDGVCMEPVQNEDDCTNDIDDDNDGLTDCADDDCVDFPCNCIDDCNAEPNDGCFMQECNSPGNQCLFIEGLACIESNCSDGIDNDGVGGADCADSACQFFNEEPNDCENGTEITCDDGFDNDGNDGADCSDPDCASAPNCQLTLQVIEICFDGVDNDGVDGSDCADSKCDGLLCDTNPESICQGTSCVPFEFTCYDGLDNDGQDGADCLDPDCENQICGSLFNSRCDSQTGECIDSEFFSSGFFGCDDMLDNDGDGATDCQDTDCGFSAVCRRDIESVCDANGVSNCAPREFTCDDGLDNDNDGDIDCADSPDCAINSASCTFTDFEIICYDGIDNETNPVLNDGIDCNDVDGDCDGQVCNVDPESKCDGNSCVPIEFTCFDGLDNDGDNDIDCMDTDCRNRPCSFVPEGFCGFSPTANCPITEVECFDGLDNDEDQDIDCDDSDCFNNICSYAPFSICNINPPDSSPSCIPTEILNCNDGLDNDGDGDIDCFDSDCDDQICSSNPAGTCEFETNSCLQLN